MQNDRETEEEIDLSIDNSHQKKTNIKVEASQDNGKNEAFQAEQENEDVVKASSPMEIFTSPMTFGNEYDDENANIKNDNKSLWFMILLLLVMIVILLISNSSLAKSTHLVVDLPPRLYALEGTVDVTADDANELYYQAHGQYILREIADFNVENHESKMKVLALLMNQSRYAYKEVDFLNEEAFVKVNNITQKVTSVSAPRPISRMPNGAAVVRVDFTVEQTVGGIPEPSAKQCFYEVAMFRQDWKLYVYDYRHSCFEGFGYGQKVSSK